MEPSSPPRVVVWLLALIGSAGPDALARWGAWLGDVAWLLGIRRRVVAHNLRLACPHIPACRRRLYGRQSYHTIGANFMQVWSRDTAAVAASVDHRNPRWAHRCIQQYAGRCVILGMHHGNWEVGPVSVASEDPTGRLLVFAKRQGLVDDLLNQARERQPVEVILAGGSGARSVTDGLRALRGGRPLGMLADQGPRPSQGVAAWFLDQPTYAFPGPAVLSARVDGALLPGVCIRVGAARNVVISFRPIPAVGKSQAELVQAQCDAMSAVIRRWPGQYFWHHRRFKYRSELSPPPPARVSVVGLMRGWWGAPIASPTLPATVSASKPQGGS